MKSLGKELVIEGARLLVCPQCASKFGRVPPRPETKSTTVTRASAPPARSFPTSAPRPVSHRTPLFRPPKPKPKPDYSLIEEMVLVEDFPNIIRTARQNAGLSQEELAQRVGERVSTLQAIETGRLKPVLKTVRGLERELGISLLEKVDTVSTVPRDEHDFEGPTLGDVVQVKRKKTKDVA